MWVDRLAMARLEAIATWSTHWHLDARHQHLAETATLASEQKRHKLARSTSHLMTPGLPDPLSSLSPTSHGDVSAFFQEMFPPKKVFTRKAF